jgi:hypothetical protein
MLTGEIKMACLNLESDHPVIRYRNLQVRKLSP